MVVAERPGGWGNLVICTLRAVARAWASTSGDDCGSILALQLLRLCAAIRQNGTWAMLRRIVPPAAAAEQAATVVAVQAVLATD